MLPASYQNVLRQHLSESQYITLQLLLLLIQSQRQVKLSVLASVFPQPIQYQSRIRNLQRFLLLPQWSIKLLWFPLLKHWLEQEETGQQLNREKRRQLQKLKHQKYGYWIVAIDRTQWKGRNVFMLSIVWGTHALPLYWELIEHPGNSDLSQQQSMLKSILPLFKDRRFLVLGDREFHSPKLAKWLDRQGIGFALRQKKSLHMQASIGEEYQTVKKSGFQTGYVPIL